MIGWLARLHRTQRGVTLIELIVALAVFALFMLMIDAVFSSARTSSRKTEIAADVQQNARVAVERLSRELHEARAPDIVIDTSQGAGRHGIAFKSARLVGTPTVFCLYVRDTDDPLSMRGTSSQPWDCFSFLGGSNVPQPPYSGPPYPLCAPNTDTNKLNPCGSYTPIWQQHIGYYVEVLADGSRQLRRVSGQLNAPVDPPGLLTGGDVIATMIESFDVAGSSGCTSGLTPCIVSLTLKAKGTEVVQGRAIPEQEILLPGQSMTRN